MKRFTKTAVVVLLFNLLIMACTQVPLTNRSQLHMIPGSEMLAMSNQQYKDFLSENRLSPNARQTKMFKRVGKKIEKTVTKYLNDNGYGDLLYGYSWEFNLVESDQVNAWCMPGGKVVVYTGILPVTKDETGLAVVMGHEIAHAIARHGNERMSQEMAATNGWCGAGRCPAK